MAVVLPAIGLFGCLAEAPSLPGRVESLDAGTPFVDMVLNTTREGIVESCGDFVTSCEQPLEKFCSAEPVLGAPDGTTYSLANGDNITLAFRCSNILEVGGIETEDGFVSETPDFTIWATVADDVPQQSRSYPVVEVSDTGLEFQSIGCLACTNQSFDLGRLPDIEVVKFVRISGSPVPVEIDAVEALTVETSLVGNVECLKECTP